MKDLFLKWLYRLFGYQSKLYNDQNSLITQEPDHAEAPELTPRNTGPVFDHEFSKGPQYRRRLPNNKKTTRGRKRQIIHFIEHGRKTTKVIVQ